MSTNTKVSKRDKGKHKMHTHSSVSGKNRGEVDMRVPPYIPRGGDIYVSNEGGHVIVW